MRIDLVTIFPEFFEGPLSTSLLGKAIEGGLVDVAVHDLRRWGRGPHRSVDDAPYGGGPGMVMRADVWFAAAEDVWNDRPAAGRRSADAAPAPSDQETDRYRIAGNRPRTVLLTPRGVLLTQSLVAELAREPRLVVCCGRYEGIDQRVHEAVATDEISVGDYVLAGGEPAAVVLIDAVARLLPGVLGNVASLARESFSDGLLEHPHYTRPVELHGMRVPPVLLSGDHRAVSRWRREQAERLTRRRRPDLYEARRTGD